MFVALIFVFILSLCFCIFPSFFKFPKFFLDLASKSPLNSLIKLVYLSLKILFLLKRRVVYFIPCSLCNLGYIGQKRRRLKFRVDEDRYKVKSEEIQGSSIGFGSYFRSNNEYFGFSYCLFSIEFQSSFLRFKIF